MLLIAFAPEALRRRTMAVELDHQLLTQANRLDERVLGGPVPRIPLVSSRRGRIKQQGIGRWIVAIGRWTNALLAGGVTVAKRILTLGPGCGGGESPPGSRR